MLVIPVGVAGWNQRANHIGEANLFKGFEGVAFWLANVGGSDEIIHVPHVVILRGNVEIAHQC